MQQKHKNSQRSYSIAQLQNQKQDIEHQSSSIPEHLSKMDNMSEISSQLESKLLRGGKFKKDGQFKLSISVQMTETNFQWLRVMLHYGYYKMDVSIIYTEIDQRILDDSSSKSGSFGVVNFVQFQNNRYAVKGVKFQFHQNQVDLSNIYREYFLCSMAEVLQVGPKMFPIFGYDLLLTKNMVFFVMEQCESIQTLPANIAQNDLLQNLRIMHAMRFMHMDIKPGNVTYSNFFQKYVFIDFGLSKLIKQPSGLKSKTRFAGTLSYCSQQMKNCYFLPTPKFVDLYDNDLHSLKKTIKALHRLHRQFSNSFEEPEVSDYNEALSEIIYVLRLKYQIQKENLAEVVKIMKRSNKIQRTICEIFQGSQIPKAISESTETKQCLQVIKAGIFAKGYQADPLDKMLYEFFCLEKRVMSAQKIIPISLILQSEPEIFNRYLVETDLVLKLFHFLQPFSNNSLNLIEDRQELKKTVVHKIYDLRNPSCNEPVFFCEKLRFVFLYFYEKLRSLNNLKIICSLRMLFISIEDWRLSKALQHQIVKIIDQPFLKMLKIVEFNLFGDSLVRGSKYENKVEWNKIISTISINSDDQRSLKMKSLLDIVIEKIDYINFSHECKMQVIKLIQPIQKQCNSAEEKESIYNIKYILIEVFALSPTIFPSDIPQGFVLGIYERFFSTLKVKLTPSELKDLKLFFGIRVEPRRFPIENPKKQLEAAVKNMIEIMSKRNELVGNIIQKVLYFDVLQKDILYIFAQMIGKAFMDPSIDSITEISCQLYTINLWFEYLYKNQARALKAERIQKLEKVGLLEKIQNTFNQFVKLQGIKSIIKSSVQLRVHCMIIEAKLDLQRGKTAEEIKSQIQTIVDLLRPFPNSSYSFGLILSLICLLGHLQSYLYSPEDHYSKQIVLQIGDGYVSKKQFYIFQKNISFTADYIRIKNQQKKYNENLSLIFQLINGMRKNDEPSTAKISNSTFLHIVKIFCATLEIGKLYEIYWGLRLTTKEFQSDLYGYLVFQMFVRVKSKLNDWDQLRQVMRTTLFLNRMPLSNQIVMRAELFRMYKHLLTFKSKRRALVWRKVEIRHTPDPEKLKMQSLLRDLSNQIYKIPLKNIENIKEKLHQRISYLNRVKFFSNQQSLANLSMLYYSNKF